MKRWIGVFAIVAAAALVVPLTVAADARYVEIGQSGIGASYADMGGTTVQVEFEPVGGPASQPDWAYVVIRTDAAYWGCGESDSLPPDSIVWHGVFEFVSGQATVGCTDYWSGTEGQATFDLTYTGWGPIEHYVDGNSDARLVQQWRQATLSGTIVLEGQEIVVGERIDGILLRSMLQYDPTP